jgi:hypothetical protein
MFRWLDTHFDQMALTIVAWLWLAADRAHRSPAVGLQWPWSPWCCFSSCWPCAEHLRLEGLHRFSDGREVRLTW